MLIISTGCHSIYSCFKSMQSHLNSWEFLKKIICVRNPYFDPWRHDNIVYYFVLFCRCVTSYSYFTWFFLKSFLIFSAYSNLTVLLLISIKSYIRFYQFYLSKISCFKLIYINQSFITNFIVHVLYFFKPFVVIFFIIVSLKFSVICLSLSL